MSGRVHHDGPGPGHGPGKAEALQQHRGGEDHRGQLGHPQELVSEVAFLSGFSIQKSGPSCTDAQDSVHHRVEEAADADLVQTLAEDDAGGRGAAGGGSADRAAAQAEDDVPAVQDRARRRRRHGRTGGDQGREEHQLEILGIGK